MWFVLALLMALFDSFKVASQKQGVKNIKTSVEAKKYASAVASLLYALPFPLVMVYRTGVPRLDHIFWYLMAAVTLLAATSSVVLMQALQKYEMSLVIPITALTPIVLIFTSSIVNGEPLTTLQKGAVLLGVIGVYMLQIDKARTGLFKPITSLFVSKEGRLGLLIVLIWSTGATFDKPIMAHSSAMFYAFCQPAFTMLFLMPIVWYKSGSIKPVLVCGKWLMLAGVFSGLTLVFQYSALPLTSIAHLFAIKRLSILFIVIWARVFFKEQHTTERLIGASITVLSVLLLYLSS